METIATVPDAQKASVPGAPTLHLEAVAPLVAHLQRYGTAADPLALVQMRSPAIPQGYRESQEQLHKALCK